MIKAIRKISTKNYNGHDGKICSIEFCVATKSTATVVNTPIIPDSWITMIQLEIHCINTLTVKTTGVFQSPYSFDFTFKN